MQNKTLTIIEFITFLAYTILIFFIQKYYILASIFMINLILLLILKHQGFTNVLKNMFILQLKLLPFIIFTSIINIMFSGINVGIIIAIRLILICEITYIFTKKMTVQKLQYVVETLLSPLKIVKIDSKETSIILCIGVTFVPIMQKEIEGLKETLKSKGYKLNIINIIKHPNYVLLPFITQIIKKVGDIETSLISKGYVE